jgi:hypothetical protein
MKDKAKPPAKAMKAKAAPKPATAKVGRPEYDPMLSDRTKVEQLVFAGMTHDDIARVLGISAPTLRKHFADEIATGRAKVMAEIMLAQIAAAKGGNVSAQKACLERAQIAESASAARSGWAVPQERAQTPPREPKLGKKEQRQVVAERGSSEGIFAVPAAPRLAVDNTR